MAEPLPPKPNLEQLKKKAKTLLRSHRHGDVAACDVLKGLNRFSGSSTQEILESTVTLKEVQFAIALSYGFKGWRQLTDHVAATSGDPAPAEETIELHLGTNYVRDTTGAVTVRHRPLIRVGYRGKARHLSLNMEIYDSEGNHTAKLRRNKWVFNDGVYTIDSNPRLVRIRNGSTGETAIEAVSLDENKIEITKGTFFAETGEKIEIDSDHMLVDGDESRRNWFSAFGDAFDITSIGTNIVRGILDSELKAGRVTSEEAQIHLDSVEAGEPWNLTFRCIKDTFRPIASENTRWWVEDDWQEYHSATDKAHRFASSREVWTKLHRLGFRFCATMESGRSIAVAALCPLYGDASVVMAVAVQASEAGRGRGRAIVSFVTDEILKSGKDAILQTARTNKAMLRAARAVGFQDADLMELLGSEILDLRAVGF